MTKKRYIKHPNVALRRKLGVHHACNQDKAPGGVIKPTKALKGWGFVL